MTNSSFTHYPTRPEMEKKWFHEIFLKNELISRKKILPQKHNNTKNVDQTWSENAIPSAKKHSFRNQKMW